MVALLLYKLYRLADQRTNCDMRSNLMSVIVKASISADLVPPDHTRMPHMACQIGRDVAVRGAWLVIDKQRALRPPADRSHWAGPWSGSDCVIDSITLSEGEGRENTREPPVLRGPVHRSSLVPHPNEMICAPLRVPSWASAWNRMNDLVDARRPGCSLGRARARSFIRGCSRFGGWT